MKKKRILIGLIFLFVLTIFNGILACSKIEEEYYAPGSRGLCQTCNTNEDCVSGLSCLFFGNESWGIYKNLCAKTDTKCDL